ncbi:MULTISPECIES: helix-turn-helix transcriptional regulator [Nostocales]|uniref:Helix-turn-helix transcriptional regulator n=3 Tax=Nostocales TaxID=1161 RepID=A0A8S9T696_9CYAN|nr:AraC family transcriptional regulator [Tolypothrix bouteillei]KAF3888091.1 helix-turn-helix transcriptional regulator [Tolypothrix bouteillei VB521301]
MANIFSLSDYEQLWQQSNQNTQSQYPDPSDSSDIINLCPKQLGIGHERWIQLHGMSLLIIDEEFHDDLIVKVPPQEIYVNEVEFGFQISGSWRDTVAQKNFFQSSGFLHEETIKASGKQRILKVDIHLDSPDLLNSFIASRCRQVSPDLKRLIEIPKQSCYKIGMTNTAMQLALEQILNCPYQGLTKHIYLEAKCLELIALKLEQLMQAEDSVATPIMLKPNDIDRIHYAKEILMSHLDNPPSLLELARQAGLNDCKLKLGFRQVFGTTVFGYLHQQRMEQARQLLLEGRMNVKEVASAVGYGNQSCFAAAFRKRFGVNPKSYLKLILPPPTLPNLSKGRLKQG